jgi:hypothetical protein
MSDTYGALATPAQLPAIDGLGAGQPIDRVLDCFGSYLSAVLIARVGGMWEAVAPSLAPVVRRVFTAHPKDVVLNESHLPALFLWRSGERFSQMADDWWINEATVTVMWLLEPGSVIQREKRLRVQGSIALNIHSALAMGRDSSWVDFGDVDPTAARRGSVLVKRAGLMTLPKPQQAEQVDVTLQPDGAEPVTYRAISTTVLVTERFKRDPAAHGRPAAVSNSVQSGGTQVDSEVGP